MAVVSIYQQATEPTDLKPGTIWFKDDGKAYVRKLDLTWNLWGQWELPNMGMVPVEGATLLGPLLGGHGLAPVNNPAFTGTATLNTIDLADKQWTTDQLTALQLSLSEIISNQLSGGSGNITIGNNLAIGYGSANQGGTIPLPVYGDNTRALLSEVWGVLPSIKYMQGHSDAITSFNWDINCSVDSSLVVSVVYNGWTVAAATINYIIVCKR